MSPIRPANPGNPMNPKNEKPPLTLRAKNRRLLLLLLSIIAGLITLSAVCVAFVFPRRHGRIPRNAREAVLGSAQQPVETSPAATPAPANSAPAPEPPR